MNIELNGNLIGNPSFLSNLWRLAYVDCSYSGITNLSPLARLTNLNSLVLAGNPLSSYAPLSIIPALRNLWLQNNAISNASFVANLHRLNYLNLDDNRLTDFRPVLALTNLTGLGLGRSPISNFTALATLTNLSMLEVEGNSISDTGFITNLFQLRYLSANHNRIINVAPLLGATNLETLYVRQNQIEDMSPLLSLPRLHDVDVRLNLLNLTDSLPAIDMLSCRRAGSVWCSCALPADSPLESWGPNVNYLPQNAEPLIAAPSAWFIPANAISSLRFSVSYELSPEDPLPVTGVSSNAVLLPSEQFQFSRTNLSRTLTVTPGADQTGTTTLILTVRNEAGLSSCANMDVTVVDPISITNMLSPGVTILDSTFESAIRQALDKGANQDELTSADLLNVTSLTALNANLGTFNGWQWLTNLTNLYLSGPLVTNITFLTNLTGLRFLGLDSVALADFGPLVGLTNLTSLYLSGACISNVIFLSALTKLTDLALNRTRVVDIAPIAGLTNLNHVDLQRNGITDIQSLVGLRALTFADLRMNVLDTNSSGTIAVIVNLQARAVELNYLPQRVPPTIEITSPWNISANRTSALTFTIVENGAPVDVSGIGSSSLDPILLPRSNLVVGRDSNSGHSEWVLVVTPAPNRTGQTFVTITATNDVDLKSSMGLWVQVTEALALDNRLFGMTDLAWRSGGDASWFGQNLVSFNGFPAAQTGNILHRQSSSLESTLIGPGTLTYWWKVSSEAQYDILVFESKRVTNRLSGEIDWHKETVAITPGTQTVQWRYNKDLDTTRGMDAGWLAHVTFVPATWLEVTGYETNQCYLDLYGLPGQEYEMQSSTNLLDWKPLATVVSTNRIIPFTDTAAINGNRFYRARAIISEQALIVAEQSKEGFTICWQGIGVVERSLKPSGPWEETGGISPLHVSIGVAPAQFFRLKVIDR